VPTEQELLRLQETLYTSKNPTRRWLHCSRRDWINCQIRKCGQHSGRALEVGPGAGGYLPVLAEVAVEVVAADIEEAYLRQAQKLGESMPGLICVEDDIANTKLSACSFDLILCTEVIEHIVDSEAALRGLHRLLTADGIVILSTPQRYSPLEICAKIAFLPGIIHLVRWIYRESIIETGHINLLTEAQVRAQIQAAGFRVESHYKLGLYLPFIAEFTGEKGLRLLKWLEGKMRDSRLAWLLWTQCYLLKK
jgi:2-polyprenyl-3-methyl-5-hydroxy-6-metoxy-1,4-benzoquinol methylase